MKTVIDFLPYKNSLADYAFQANCSRGRRYHFTRENDLTLPFSVDDDDRPYFTVLDPFFLDWQKIQLSKSLRRLADKTQVFMNHQENWHVRNRKIHTDEVTALAMQIASILGLNIFLAGAAALGHDLGHSPFGHLGEMVISELSGRSFRHEIMSVVIAQKIERSGQGLNLSFETLESILHHSRGKNVLKTNAKLPLEYSVVMYADKIAYTFSDLNDALRVLHFGANELPTAVSDLGKNQRERWLNCLYALIRESAEKRCLSFQDSEVAQKFEEIRQWSYHNFYGKLDDSWQRQAARLDLCRVYKFLRAYPSEMHYDPFLIMALLTDQEAKKIAAFAEQPTINDLNIIKNLNCMEILESLPRGQQIDIFNPDLEIGDFSKAMS